MLRGLDMENFVAPSKKNRSMVDLFVKKKNKFAKVALNVACGRIYKHCPYLLQIFDLYLV